MLLRLSLLIYIGFDVKKIVLWTDSKAAKAIMEKQGVSNIRHFDGKSLWIQDQVQKKIVRVEKVLGTENRADIHTKALKKPLFDKMCEKMNMIELSDDILSTGESKCLTLRQRRSAAYEE